MHATKRTAKRVYKPVLHLRKGEKAISKGYDPKYATLLHRSYMQ